MEGQEPTNQGQEPATTVTVSTTGTGQESKPTAQTQQDVNANAPVKVEELPANVQNLIKELRAENANHRKAKESAEKEAQDAKERQMAEQQEWKALAEERGKQLDGYKVKAEQYDKLAPILSKQLEAEINEWPEKVRNLFPADEMSVTDMMEWANRFRPLAQEMAGDKTPTPGNPPKPRPASSSKVEQETRDRWRQQAAGRYR